MKGDNATNSHYLTKGPLPKTAVRAASVLNTITAMDEEGWQNVLFELGSEKVHSFVSIHLS